MEYRSVNAGFGYVVRLEKDEQVIASLRTLAEKEDIHGAFFYGFGAVKDTTLGRYDIEQRKYIFRDYEDVMELVSVNGNIARSDDTPAVHAHAVITGEDLAAVGGHLKEASVAITCELFIHLQHGTEMIRTEDDTTGLNLLHFK